MFGRKRRQEEPVGAHPGADWDVIDMEPLERMTRAAEAARFLVDNHVVSEPGAGVSMLMTAFPKVEAMAILEAHRVTGTLPGSWEELESMLDMSDAAVFIVLGHDRIARFQVLASEISSGA